MDAESGGSVKLIYFLRRTDGTGPIKIGCSAHPKGRATQLQSDHRATFEILAEAAGDFILERNLHLKFAALKTEIPQRSDRATPIGGASEWFAAEPELLDFIEKVKRDGRITLPTTDCRERIFATRYQSGETLQQIANDFGITRERVRQVLRQTGVPSAGLRPFVGENISVAARNAERVLDLAKSGKTVMDIVREVGSDPLSIRRVLKYHGVRETRGKMGRPFVPEVAERARAIVADYNAGLKVVEITAKHGVSIPEIYRSLRRFGGQLRRKAA